MMENKLVKVKDYPHLVKDMESGAILNTDIRALEMYKKNRDRNELINNLDQRMDSVESTLSEIQSALKILLERNK